MRILGRLGTICIWLSLTGPSAALAAFSNYNSILIGDRAAGMGGAFTAMTGDPAACSFYNPACLVWMEGSSISANVNVYNKYDQRYGTQSDFDKAPLRINRGFFRSLPASSGSVLNFGKFALGLSIVLPDYDFFSGEVRSNDTTSSFLSYVDESLWVGGALSLRLSEDDSVGLTAYYTARSLIRSVNDTVFLTPTSAVITTEEKNLTNNSLVYLLGYQRNLGGGFRMGTSFRFPSIEISGTGAYYKSVIQTDPFLSTPISNNSLKSETRIPSRLSAGLSYEAPKRYSYSFDVSLYGRELYRDLDINEGADIIDHKPVANFALGYEYFVRSWLRWRLGGYTNFSSHPNPDVSDNRRHADSIQMWGFSTNIGLYTQEKVSFTFGGYYTGGRGNSAQQVGNRLEVMPKNLQIFTMLVGSAYYF